MCEVNGIRAIHSPSTIVFKIPYRALQASDFASSRWSSESGPMWSHPLLRGAELSRECFALLSPGFRPCSSPAETDSEMVHYSAAALGG